MGRCGRKRILPLGSRTSGDRECSRTIDENVSLIRAALSETDELSVEMFIVVRTALRPSACDVVSNQLLVCSQVPHRQKNRTNVNNRLRPHPPSAIDLEMLRPSPVPLPTGLVV
jgi:hypothetical protein